MASTPYQIKYVVHPTASFPTKAGMRAYLAEERKAWGPFLEELPKLIETPIPFQRNKHQTVEGLSTVLDVLEKRLDDPAQFNELTARALVGHGMAVPPSSDSEEGKLILALFDVGRNDLAVAAYTSFIVDNFKGNVVNHPVYGPVANRGRQLLEAATVASVLPFSKVSSAKLAGAARKAENHNAALGQEVAKAIEINRAHETNLAEVLQQQRERGSKLDNAFRRLNKRRARQFDEWKLKITSEVSERFEEAERRIVGMERLSRVKLQKQEEEFERLQDLFSTQLRLRAPVKLWEGRENSHSANSKAALVRLFLFGALTAAIAIAAPVFFGDYIADSFFEIVCSPQGAEGSRDLSCERFFSAKGPLTVTGLLLVMSILTWITRLQYRIHLSERHLALDASEKKAFAETYLAMKEGEDVGQDNEAIVLASLFRPTQDGIIRDDETGMDLSAVALLAKQLGRN
ncbi:hypothetical protein DSM14862_01980 [Sulfitobacter indolifex]|uniref:DUF6161 domain-containing protein n=1 Tax=Sulfitobacter indolifex HEL-45 TaxID=391624 RepID=A0ABP2D816_9RHOB|nr:DUF6161 domain-containing protein [Sulfitobacter indolifex]EDQ04342.1 hypothetical protein OIHEL45_15474 [Sulfitobacter indolifex HEL-45]UOA19191.1 hypothetical protein DSM14862_01980 [Sulfitobacter indolifex]